jgi:hypothetical protein
MAREQIASPRKWARQWVAAVFAKGTDHDVEEICLELHGAGDRHDFIHRSDCRR